MNAIVVTSGVWLFLVVAGMALYFTYTKWMPAGIATFFSGLKLKIVGVIVAVSPDLLTFLSFLQIIGNDWLPSDKFAWVLRGIGTMITVLRYITDNESKT